MAAFFFDRPASAWQDAPWSSMNGLVSVVHPMRWWGSIPWSWMHRRSFSETHRASPVQRKQRKTLCSNTSSSCHWPAPLRRDPWVILKGPRVHHFRSKTWRNVAKCLVSECCMGKPAPDTTSSNTKDNDNIDRNNNNTTNTNANTSTNNDTSTNNQDQQRQRQQPEPTRPQCGTDEEYDDNGDMIWIDAGKHSGEWPRTTTGREAVAGRQLSCAMPPPKKAANKSSGLMKPELCWFQRTWGIIYQMKETWVFDFEYLWVMSVLLVYSCLDWQTFLVAAVQCDSCQLWIMPSSPNSCTACIFSNFRDLWVTGRKVQHVFLLISSLYRYQTNKLFTLLCHIVPTVL